MKNPVKKPSWWDEFAAFAIEGNAMALAVGTIIGAAFSTITKSLTDDIIMPIVSIFMGGIDFSEMKIVLPRLMNALNSPIRPRAFLVTLLLSSDIAILHSRSLYDVLRYRTSPTQSLPRGGRLF